MNADPFPPCKTGALAQGVGEGQKQVGDMEVASAPLCGCVMRDPAKINRSLPWVSSVGSGDPWWSQWTLQALVLVSYPPTAPHPFPRL